MLSMINRKITVLFFVCFSVSVHASEDEGLRAYVADYIRKASFERVLPVWQKFYAPLMMYMDQPGRPVYEVNNCLAYWLVRRNLCGTIMSGGLDAAAYYAFNAAPYLVVGQEQKALKNFKEQLVTDAIVTSASLAVPILGTVLNTRIRLFEGTPQFTLDPMVRVVARFAVVRPYIFPPEKEEKVTLAQQAAALGMAIHRYENTLTPEELNRVRASKKDPVKYLRELETRVDSEKRIGIFGAKAYGFKSIAYQEAIENGIRTADTAPSGEPFCVVCAPPKRISADRFFGESNVPKFSPDLFTDDDAGDYSYKKLSKFFGANDYAIQKQE